MSLVKVMLNGNEVKYDNTEFELIEFDLLSEEGKDYLHYVGDGKNVRNPKGNISCRNMFGGCYNLKELDLSNFDTSNIEDMNSMFEGCESLKELDLSNFDTGKVEDMSYMFNGCRALRSLDLSNFNTVKVKDMSYMFNGCGLDGIDLSSFETFNVKNFECMFSSNKNLGFLDISLFEISNDSNVDGIFSYCANLMDFYIDKDALSVVEKGKNTFKGCNHINIIETQKDNLRILELDLLKGVNAKEAYKKQKDRYLTSDSDFISILYKVRPDSPMVSSYVSKVLLPKIEKCFNEGMSVRDVRKNLYKNYSICLSDDVLVSFLKCFYIVGLDTKSITYESSESLLDSKYEDEFIPYYTDIEEIKEDNKIEDLNRKKILSYFNFVNGDSSVTVGDVIEIAYKHFNKRFVNETILSILGNECI